MGREGGGVHAGWEPGPRLQLGGKGVMDGGLGDHICTHLVSGAPAGTEDVSRLPPAFLEHRE